MLVTDEVAGTSPECLPSFSIAMLSKTLHRKSATSVCVFGAALKGAGRALKGAGRLLCMSMYRRLSCSYSCCGDEIAQGTFTLLVGLSSVHLTVPLGFCKLITAFASCNLEKLSLALSNVWTPLFVEN